MSDTSGYGLCLQIKDRPTNVLKCILPACARFRAVRATSFTRNQNSRGRNI